MASGESLAATDPSPYHQRCVLVVEDDPDLRSIIIRTLARWDLTVYEAGDGRSAVELVSERSPDVVVLDLGLPDLDGIHLLARLAHHPRTRVLVVSGRATPDERALGLELGADDYLIKPFHPSELRARLERLLRWPPADEHHDPTVRVGPLALDLDRRAARVHGEDVSLTRREFDLLVVLAVGAGFTFSRAELLRQVWASEPTWQDSATVTEHVRRLRIKLGRAGHLVETVRGVGYRLRHPDSG